VVAAVTASGRASVRVRMAWAEKERVKRLAVRET
jgi:hypothetical protein